MSPGDHSPVDEEEDHSNPTKGGAPLKLPQEIPSSRDPISRGNTIPNEFISSQPLPASQEAAGQIKPQSDPQKPTCPHCGLTVPDPPPPSRGQVQSSVLSVDSRSSSSSSSSKKKKKKKKRRRSGSNVANSHQPAATAHDACFHLLLACLSCQCSVLLLGLLEACSSCLHALCSSCCHACARCCSAIQEAPVEEFNCHAHCHSVLFESCCEPTECLEFCLECCEICHRS